MRPLFRRLPFYPLKASTHLLPRTRPPLLFHYRRRLFHNGHIRSHSVQDGSQTVQVSKRLFTTRRVALFVIYLTGTNFVLGLLRWKLSANVDLEDIQELDELEDDTSSVFIPLQMPYKLDQTFYRQSDPEWQEFVKVSNDDARKDSLRDELAQRVARDVGAHPEIQSRLGQNINLTKYWLDLKFPDGPPPEYARSGIELDEQYISWSTQVITHSHYTRLTRILYPSALFQAFKSSIDIFYRIQLVKIKDLLGLELSSMDKRVRAVYRVVRGQASFIQQQEQLKHQRGDISAERKELEQQLLEREHQQRQQESSTDSSKSSPHAPPSRSAPTAISIMSPLIPAPTPSSDDPEGRGLRSALLGLLHSVLVAPDVFIPVHMFSQTLKQQWGRSQTGPLPKGTFLVSGQVEVMGDRGRVKCDVQAAYDPHTATFVSVVCAVKDFWELQQAPKGGR